MYSASEDSKENCIFSIQEVEKALTEIENKYSTTSEIPKHRGVFEETLAVLSKVRRFVSIIKNQVEIVSM